MFTQKEASYRRQNFEVGCDVLIVISTVVCQSWHPYRYISEKRYSICFLLLDSLAARRLRFKMLFPSTLLNNPIGF